MKCKEFKYFLLGCENPDQPPADVKAHLAGCSDCQDWQNRLAVIEMNVPFLPVPESAALAGLLRLIQTQPLALDKKLPAVAGQVEVEQTSPAVLKRIGGPSSPPAPESLPRQGAGVLVFFRAMEPSARRFAAGGLAAAILLVAFGWMVIRTPNRPTIPSNPATRLTSDPLVASILKRDLRLAEAENATDRFRDLADLADDFCGEVKALAPLPEAKDVLDDLVDKYERVINGGLLQVAKELPILERDDLLNKVGDRLHAAGRQAEELGNKLGPKIPNGSRDALHRLTRVATKGDNNLRALRTEASRMPLQNTQQPNIPVLVQKERP